MSNFRRSLDSALGAVDTALGAVRNVFEDLVQEDEVDTILLQSPSVAQADSCRPETEIGGDGEETSRKRRLATKRIIETLMEEQDNNRSDQKDGPVIDPTSAHGRAIACTQHRLFQAWAAALVTLNAAYMGVEATMRQCQDDLAIDGWFLAQVTFTVLFAVELALRVFAQRRNFFRDYWNSFDALLVASAVVDTVVLRNIADGGGGKVDLLVALRCLRLTRLARIFRLIRFFKELWFLVEGIIAAARTLVWAWLLTFVVLYLSAIFATKLIGGVSPVGSQARVSFDNVPRSMYSLFQVMSVEGWVSIARVAIAEQPWTGVFFIVFLSITSFSIMHVVVAVIVQNTLARASHRNEEEASVREAREQEVLVKIAQVFELSDVDGNGEVTREEFMKALENPEVVEYLHKVNVDVRHAESLFDILDYDESGSLDAAEFVEGVMTARGEAESKDLLAVQCDLWKSEQRMRHSMSKVKRALKAHLTVRLRNSVVQCRKDIRKVLREVG